MISTNSNNDAKNSNDSSATGNSPKLWIYHERQYGQLCGQHALNNFVQGPIFTISQLADIAEHLNDVESQIFTEPDGGESHNSGASGVSTSTGITAMMNRITGTSTGTRTSDRARTGSHHVDEAGNFSIEVLKAAMIHTYNVALVHLGSQVAQQYLSHHDITTIEGFICHKNDHWFCIRMIHQRYWNLNSTLERPAVVPHFTLAMEMEQYATQHGYTIFCVLPPQTLPNTSSSMTMPPNDHFNSGASNENWHLIADLLRGKSTTSNTATTSIVDPWGEINGTGRRLDGHDPSGTQQPTSSVSAAVIDGLTEDEMIQLAMQQSMEPTTSTNVVATATKTTTNIPTIGPVPNEPDDATAMDDVIKIQFRFPTSQHQNASSSSSSSSSNRLVRRFYRTNTIADIYSFIMSIVDTSFTHNNGKENHLECMVGYPPKNMLHLYPNATMTTIQETNLSNATIQIRYI